MRFGLVSDDVPLISNLDVWRNIALVPQYHGGLSEKKARELVQTLLSRFNIERIAALRNPSLTEEERFLVMLLRATMVRDAIVVIDRPFKLVPYLKDLSFVYENLKKIEELYSLCYILEYAHRLNRPEVGNGRAG